MRAAINAAMGSTLEPATIVFSVSGTIFLGSTLPMLGSGLTIGGAGQKLTISGNGSVGRFGVYLGNKIKPKNLNISDGAIASNSGVKQLHRLMSSKQGIK